MGVGQVMPSTAMQPGYGVTNIFDLAEQRGIAVPSRDTAGAQALLANEGLNREFGQSYFNAMQQRFPQDPAASVAAYNAGPGRVGQNLQANAGQLNMSQMPNETQAYVNKVLNRMPPQAQAPAAAQPQAPTQLVQEPPGTPQETAPVAPTALVQEPPAPAPAAAQPMIAGMPSSDVGLTPTEQALQDPYMQRFTAAQKDPNAMWALSQDDAAPQWVKNLAYKEVATYSRNKTEEEKANQMTDPNAIAKELSRKNADGSWVKYYLMKRLGLNEAATQEASKLGLTNSWNTYNINGKNYLVNTQADGLPIAGIDPETGKAVPASIYQQISGTAKDIQQSNDIYKDPTQATGPAFYYERRPGGVAVFKEVGTGRIASPTEAAKLIKVGVAGTLPQQFQGAFGKAAYGESGKAAGQGLTPTTIPGAPGMGPGAVPGGEAPTVPTTPTVPGAPAAAASPAPAAQPAPVVSGNANIPNAFATPPAPEGAPTISQQRRAGEIQEKRSVAFNEIIDKEYRVDGQNGEVISENRKLQFDILNRKDPVSGKGVAEEISGLYTAANQRPGDQKLTIVRDILTGKVGRPEDRISERIAELNISPAAKSALQEYNALNAQIAGRTLRDTAGPGAVSDAEQQANRARNVDIGRAPMLGAYNMMSQSQFAGDLSRYKSDLASSSDAKSATLFERDFRKTREELIKSYREVTDARLDYINKNGGATNPAAIREGYKLFPVPQYDVSTGNWRYLKPLNKIIQ
jgi:hypothetical protein